MEDDKTAQATGTDPKIEALEERVAQLTELAMIHWGRENIAQFLGIEATKKAEA